MSPRKKAAGAMALLTKSAAGLLRKLGKGATLKATRTYPHPHKFEATRIQRQKDGSTLTVTSSIQGADVSALVELGLITATPVGPGGPDGNRDQRTDQIDYAISTAGRVALEDAKALTQKPDSQADMFGAAS